MATHIDLHSIDAGLDRLAESRAFARSGNQIRLLRFLLGKSQQERDCLKETYIGTVFYNRPASYDPQLDSIVRVNVGRLRLRLLEYYETEGKHDLLRIDIPLGSYAPVVTMAGSHLVVAGADPAAARRSSWIWPALGLAAVAALPLLLAHTIVPRPIRLAVQQERKWYLTPGLDTETDPAVSPDGKQMVYVSRLPGDSHFRIFMRPYALTMMAGQVLNTGDGDVLHPAWSPDGKQLAFLHCANLTCEIERYSFADGSIHMIRNIPAFGLNDDQIYLDTHNPRPVWTADGNALLFPVSDSENAGLRLVRHDLATDQETKLVPGDDSGEDTAAALSPDGRSLGYLHRINDDTSVMTFNLVTQKSAVIASGWPVNTIGFAWAPDLKSIVISANRYGDGWALWDISLDGMASQVIVPLTTPIYPVFTPDGKNLLVLSVRNGQNLVLADDRELEKSPSILFRSEEGLNVTAEISPDGKEVAQLLPVGGSYEVWISSLDHGMLSPRRQLTHGLNIRHAASVAWSPDGKTLAIATTVSIGFLHLVDTATGAVTRLQVPALKDSFLQSPAWSPDSGSLYIGASNGPDGIFKISVGPVPVVQKIVDCSVRDLQLDGGLDIYYEPKKESGIYRVSLRGEPEPESIPELAKVRVSRNWKIADGGLYYIDLHDAVRRLHRYDLKTGRITTVSGDLPRVVFLRGAIDYAPRQHLLLYSQWSDDASSQITAFPMQ